MKRSLDKNGRRRKSRRPFHARNAPKLKLHPLFWLVGAWYCFTGELFLFLMSCLVALQHECAHAFAAAKLGYKLNRVVLMPFGAVIDGDLRGISLKDETFVALCGPLCNFLTAAFFVAVWWCFPDAYAFTDTACYSSLAIALVNLVPAYPLDGGRVLHCCLTRSFMRRADAAAAEERSRRVCRLVTLLFSACCFALFIAACARGAPNFTLLAFGGFLLVGALGNRDEAAVYDKMDISSKEALSRGVEIKRVAVLENKPIKDIFRYLSRGSYLVLEVYDQNESLLFELSQNELSRLFLCSASPYTTLGEVGKSAEKSPETAKSRRKTVKNC
ncbi:MAG: hypothetical protein IJ514_07340 [Clostridia bacterium]|nr:hypothetical protein [Clostridia bacterium]